MTEPVSNDGVFIPDGPVNMLIIDPQVDFHEGGNLAIQGATADSTRIARFITETALFNSTYNINKIFVTLDTHTIRHIGHPAYWKRTDGTHDPLPEFTTFDVKDDKIKAKLNGVEVEVDVEPVEPGLFEWTKSYIELINQDYTKATKNKQTSKGRPLIWPIHCLETSDGHAVHRSLKPTLLLDQIYSKVEYHIKGQCEATEMYSIFKAEVPYNQDLSIAYSGVFNAKQSKTSLIDNLAMEDINDSDKPKSAYLNTNFNEILFNSITSGSKPILICGQALSHCVNWSLRDLVEKILENKLEEYCNNSRRILKSDKVILLINASSPVGSFEQNVVDLIQFCKQKNVSIKFLSEDGKILNQKLESYKPHDNIQKALNKYLPSGGGNPRRRTRKLNRRHRERMMKRRRHRRTRK